MKQLYLLLITLLVSLSAYAEKSGNCGANLKWKLTDKGVLTITGTGEMQNWEDRHARPWSPDSNIKQVIIGDGVTTIGVSAFHGCSSLTSVTIPNSVTTIGNFAFYNCSSLTSVTIPNSVTEIGVSAFYGCSSLTSITIPNSVTIISSYAFSYCSSLTSVTIGNGVTTIWGGAFYGCGNVKQISCDAELPPNCTTDLFESINKWECKLIVPKNSVDAYKRAYGWRYFFLIEGSTTGIINTIDDKIDNVDVYTIDGIKRLSKANVNEINALPKGIYIINGKKIVIK